MKRFAIRPEPFEDESFNGFLLRVGKLNCIFRPAEILDRLGSQSTPASLNPGWLEAPTRLTFKALESKLERPLESHRVRFKAREQLQWLRSEDRMISDLRLGFPRICPDCVSEQGYLDWRWGLAITAHCPKHERLLVESCPDCDKQLKWSGSLLIGCPHCDTNWSDMELSHASEISKTERYIWQETSADFGNVDKRLLKDICVAISTAMRPFDVIHEPVKYCPSLVMHSDFVRRAYLLLESPEMNASWREECHKKRSEVRFLGKDFVEAPCNLFSARLEMNWQGPHGEPAQKVQTTALDHGFPEVTKYISQSRRDRDLESKGGEGYRYHVTFQSFAEITGMDMEYVQELFQGNALVSHKNVRCSRRRRFDLRQFDRLLKPVSTLDNPIEILPDDKRLKKYLVSFEQLANAVIKGSINGVFPGIGNFEKLYIGAEHFKRWLKAQLRSRRKKEEVKLEQITQALDCSVKDIDKLVDEGHLKWAKTRRDKTRIDCTSYIQHVMRSSQAENQTVTP